MITKGLSFRGSYSLDNTFRETQRGINDLYNGPQRKWIDPETGAVVLENCDQYGYATGLFGYGTLDKPIGRCGQRGHLSQTELHVAIEL